MRRALGIVLVSAALLSWGWNARRDPLPGFPRVVLWAWERPEDLRFLSAGRTGVAFLAKTVRLDGERIGVRPRMQPLRVGPATPLMAVVRIESSGRGVPARGNVLEATVEEVSRSAELPGVQAVQVDFDARESERGWYRELLERVRLRLPSRVPLTMTALVSWCGYEEWLDGLPVADAAPMLFRMGAGEQAPVHDFAMALCRGSVGLSTDELPSRVPRRRRLYFFHPRPWTERDYEAALSQARRWQ